MRKSTLFWLFSLPLLAFTVFAQEPPPPYQFDPIDIQRKAATFIGGTNFLSQQCGLATPEQIRQVHSQQREAAIATGLPAEEFDRLYVSSKESTSQMWERGSQEDRDETCEQARQLIGAWG